MSRTALKQSAMIESRDLVELMSSPHAYDERVTSVECIETHISWVFLTDRHAYKLKKPVKFEFLDFSTPQLRRQACEQEVSLNRRLAGEVYRGVAPITLDRGRLTFNGKGEAVDWVVKMRRLPADRSLDRLIAAGKFSPRQLDELAAKLVSFYVPLSPVMLTTSDYLLRLEQHLAANREELLDPRHRLAEGVVKRIHAAQFRLLRLAPDVFADRVCDGRIVDGHGDLRPEHIYFASAPVVIDCLEFSADLRQVDVLDDLAFLAIECEILGAGWIGNRILDRYRAESGDHFSASLVNFYKSYRACVRAKVAALRCDQVPDDQQQSVRDEAIGHLELADRHARPIGPPLLVTVYGLSGSGKSTLAGSLAAALRVERLATDDIRREQSAAPVHPQAYGEGEYRLENRLRVYEQMLSRAEEALEDGQSLILDGTFPTVSLRQRVVELARRRAAVPLLIHCDCPPEVALERIVARQEEGGSTSDATPQIFRWQRQEFESDDPTQPVCVVDTSGGINSEVETIFRRLRRAGACPDC